MGRWSFRKWYMYGWHRQSADWPPVRTRGNGTGTFVVRHPAMMHFVASCTRPCVPGPYTILILIFHFPSSAGLGYWMCSSGVGKGHCRWSADQPPWCPSVKAHCTSLSQLRLYQFVNLFPSLLCGHISSLNIISNILAKHKYLIGLLMFCSSI